MCTWTWVYPPIWQGWCQCNEVRWGGEPLWKPQGATQTLRFQGHYHTWTGLSSPAGPATRLGTGISRQAELEPSRPIPAGTPCARRNPETPKRLNSPVQKSGWQLTGKNSTSGLYCSVPGGSCSKQLRNSEASLRCEPTPANYGRRWALRAGAGPQGQATAPPRLRRDRQGEDAASVESLPLLRASELPSRGKGLTGAGSDV